MSVFKGNTMECLAHLEKAISDDHLAKREILATFVGVESANVRRWFNGTVKPAGEPLLRLRFYLEFLGYQVEEIQKLAPAVRDTARLLAFRVVSLSDIVGLVGYPEGRGGTDSLLATLRGMRGVSEERLAHFVSLVELYRGQLPEKQRATRRVQLSSVPRVSAEAEPPAVVRSSVVQPLRPASRQAPGTHDALIESLAGSVKAMIPLARAISSDDFTPDERARLRELAGSDGVFTLANLLYRLCGERARKIHS